MIAWTDEAIEAANALLNKEWAAGIPDDLMRRALDAAVTAQLGEKVGLLEGFTRNAWEDARVAALDEAAKVCEGDFDSEMRAYGKAFAAAIRALAKQKPGI